ncbi:hypothetical protein THAOC_18094 [Thalassiosira oceanica]|uniref:Uncharacterized protein n=1 Tax=Thalassiosira oceanica TaxID=159749 RepID=K0S8Z0_THAOC|nr:hypothetical protein THAOC_18094 [Thalassiosira oceanica]|eukprot:EJK61424.1 hypothetical protein THAOC_18094 [Thalassiosira oceanica]
MIHALLLTSQNLVLNKSGVTACAGGNRGCRRLVSLVLIGVTAGCLMLIGVTALEPNVDRGYRGAGQPRLYRLSLVATNTCSGTGSFLAIATFTSLFVSRCRLRALHLFDLSS